MSKSKWPNKVIEANRRPTGRPRRSVLALGHLAMRNKIALRLWGVLGLVLLCGPTGGRGAAPVVAPYPKTNLMAYLAQWKPTAEALRTVCELEPQWVGTVSRVSLRGGEDLYRHDPPNPIRFSHLTVYRDSDQRTNLIILRGRITAQGKLGGWTDGEAPVFTNHLPSAQAVSAARDLNDLRRLFGPQHGMTDGVGGNGREHWVESWTWFTAEGQDRLRVLRVFAHVSSPVGAKSADIDILHVSEGLFHPANPNSAAERKQFKTGAEVQAEREARQAQARTQYPQPLRALVEAGETPDDHHLIAYVRALNEVRRKPDPKLFRQFAEWIDEGTCEIRLMLESILFDSSLKLQKWEEPQRKIALRALADALPNVKTSQGLDQLLVFLLQAHGGGELKVAVPGTTAVVDVKTQRAPDGGGSSCVLGSSNISSDILARAARQCREMLRERYPELR